MTALAILAVFPAVATPYFFVLWTWFEFWRRHIALTFLVLVGMIGGWTVSLIVWREEIFARAIAMPPAARAPEDGRSSSRLS